MLTEKSKVVARSNKRLCRGCVEVTKGSSFMVKGQKQREREKEKKPAKESKFEQKIEKDEFNNKYDVRHLHATNCERLEPNFTAATHTHTQTKKEK